MDFDNCSRLILREFGDQLKNKTSSSLVIMASEPINWHSRNLTKYFSWEWKTMIEALTSRPDTGLHSILKTKTFHEPEINFFHPKPSKTVSLDDSILALSLPSLPWTHPWRLVHVWPPSAEPPAPAVWHPWWWANWLQEGCSLRYNPRHNSERQLSSELC